VDNHWNEYDAPYLKHSRAEEDSRPHACPRDSNREEPHRGESRLNECDAEYAKRDASDSGSNQVQKLGTLVAEQAVEK
jgi:hypothetical protein